ncbi:hypothetical protein [Sediminimonas sp.]|uniref:hypothetical protein n=1 Tax=Sediminimonas sp. TaxID=2823379 RepID=UPI0025EAE601|nr:hypothetical protein [Sediminimonas sp.]
MAATPLAADEITDALESARDAYEAGDIQYAIEELDFAKQRLAALKTDELAQFLPPAPEGWERRLDSEIGGAMAMMGGGSGAEAEYTPAGEGAGYTITMMADSPMIAAVAAMMSNAGMMGVQVERVGRQKFIVQDGEVTGLVANRILIKAAGADPDTLLAALEQIDYRALGRFGQ